METILQILYNLQKHNKEVENICVGNIHTKPESFEYRCGGVVPNAVTKNFYVSSTGDVDKPILLNLITFGMIKTRHKSIIYTYDY